MENHQISVESKVTGRETGSGLSQVVLDVLNERITIRELIARTVEEQIREMVSIQRMEWGEIMRIINRQYLTEDEVQDQAGRYGKVELPKLQETPMPVIQVKAEIKKAQKGFEARSYVIYIDGRQAESLDQEIELGIFTRVTFLRLTPLIGG